MVDADARWAAVSAPHGTAALAHTHWLDGTPRAYAGAPGQWWTEDGRVHGDLGEGVTLAPFEQIAYDDLLLRAFARDDDRALRVFDPANPARTALRGIESFGGGEEWAITGRFTPAPEGETRTVVSADGYERAVPATGTIALSVHGQDVTLVVAGDEGGLDAVISDATAATGAYRFRFLPISAPDADGTVVVDFRRAFLPPCAFSDEYVGPLPTTENRLPFAVEAGERRALRD